MPSSHSRAQDVENPGPQKRPSVGIFAARPLGGDRLPSPSTPDQLAFSAYLANRLSTTPGNSRRPSLTCETKVDVWRHKVETGHPPPLVAPSYPASFASALSSSFWVLDRRTPSVATVTPGPATGKRRVSFAEETEVEPGRWRGEGKQDLGKRLDTLERRLSHVEELCCRATPARLEDKRAAERDVPSARTLTQAEARQFLIDKGLGELFDL